MTRSTMNSESICRLAVLCSEILVKRHRSNRGQTLTILGAGCETCLFDAAVVFTRLHVLRSATTRLPVLSKEKQHVSQF